MGIFTMGKLLHIKSNYMSGPTARLKKKKKEKIGSIKVKVRFLLLKQI